RPLPRTRFRSGFLHLASIPRVLVARMERSAMRGSVAAMALPRITLRFMRATGATRARGATNATGATDATASEVRVVEALGGGLQAATVLPGEQQQGRYDHQ